MPWMLPRDKLEDMLLHPEGLQKQPILENLLGDESPFDTDAILSYLDGEIEKLKHTGDDGKQKRTEAKLNKLLFNQKIETLNTARKWIDEIEHLIANAFTQQAGIWEPNTRRAVFGDKRCLETFIQMYNLFNAILLIPHTDFENTSYGEDLQEILCKYLIRLYVAILVATKDIWRRTVIPAVQDLTTFIDHLYTDPTWKQPKQRKQRKGKESIPVGDDDDDVNDDENEATY